MDGLRVILGPILSMPVLFSLLTGLVTAVVACVFTRFSTGSRFRQEVRKTEPKAISILPYWIPWFGHTLFFAPGSHAFINQCRQVYKHAAFAIVLRGKKYSVITAPSLVQQLEGTDALEVNIDTRPYKLRHFFGDRSSSSRLNETLACYNHDSVVLMGSDGISRTRKHAEKIARAVERAAYNLISFNASWIDQSGWERMSKTVVPAGSGTMAEVSFFPLIESFVGEISTTSLLGRNFLENNPSFLEDVLLWNSKGTSFMNQMPLFLPQMSAAAAARERMLRSLKRFRGILSAYSAGDDPGSDWGDLNDVSPFMSERIEQWNAENKSSPVHPDVSADAALLWAFNKPNTFVAWLLYRVYSDSAMLAEVRKEIEPFVRVEYVKSGLPISESPRVTIDSEGLMKESSLLRGVMNETLRLHTNAITHGVVTKNLVLTESQDDATNLGKDKPESYIFRKGELVCIPLGANHIGQDLGHGPGTFNPAGFNSLANLKVPSDSASDASQASHVFGVRGVTCPGRGLAEQEIMVVAAVILSMWEVKGTWTWPGQQPGLCSTLPIDDVRVRISRRKAAM